MKKFYKFATVLLALVILLPFETIHAAAYDDCDVNHDGFVDISDAVILSRYLAGDLYVSDYNRFDTDKSLTIDSSDVRKILSKIALLSYSAQYWSKLGNCTVSFPSVSGFIPEPSADPETSRTYIKHSYVNDHYNTYSLTPNAAVLNNIPSNQTPRTIVGTDDRQPSSGFENTGVVYFTNEFGTGFIIDDHIIATAAHCVYNRASHKFISSLTIHPYNSNGTVNTSVSFNVIEIHVPTDYDTADDDDNDIYDYALITVSDDLSNYMHFSLGTTYNLTQTNFANIPLYVLGPRMTYPTDTDLYYGQGNMVSAIDTTYDELIYYNIDTQKNDSGSPVYTIIKATVNNQTYNYYTVLAIHIRKDTTIPIQWNAGNRITKYHLQFFDKDSNPNISWT